MEISELQKLLQDPTKLANKLEVIAPVIDDIRWEPETHEVMDESKRTKRKISTPTGQDDAEGNPIMREEWEEVNRIPSATNKEIVDWSVRMALGVPVQLDATPKDSAQETMVAMLRKTISANKMEFLDQEIERQRLIYLNVLELWYVDSVDADYWAEIAPGTKPLKWKVTIMSAEHGDTIIPIFNKRRELVAVGRIYTDTVSQEDGLGADKEVKRMELYMDAGIYTFSQDGGTWVLESSVPNVTGKLMGVLWQAKRRETADVEPKLKRIETIDSDTADENEASGRPILAVWGQIQAVSKRGDTGKTYQLTGGGSANEKPDMKYVERDGAADQVANERKVLRADVYHDTATPDPAMFNELASGNAPGINIKLRFTPATNKALSRQQGELGIGHQRRINVLKSAMAYINPAVKPAVSMEIRPKFGLSLPENTIEKHDDIINLVAAGLLSREKAVEMLALTDDNEAELARINADLDAASARAVAARPTPPVQE